MAMLLCETFQINRPLVLSVIAVIKTDFYGKFLRLKFIAMQIYGNSFSLNSDKRCAEKFMWKNN